MSRQANVERNRLSGVLAPVLTPFDQESEPDFPAFLAHCRWLLDNGAGLAIFGTNSEAASLSTDERIALTDGLIEAGIPADRLMPGTGACSVKDAIRLTRHAVQSGAAGVLMLPPFYFKNVSEEGILSYYAEVIDAVAEPNLAIYLYHIPQLTQVPITLSLIERLLKRYPRAIAGAKDSSGDWANSRAMIENFAEEGFDVFPASEIFLSDALSIGGAGCISATVNINPAAISSLFRALSGDQPSHQTRPLQAQVDEVRRTFQSFELIPAMKSALAHYTGKTTWKIVRPPLTPLSQSAHADLLKKLASLKFEMPVAQ
ncbi:dihydrodipicolinate synthase family protein [Bradyrhizobium sp. Ash2021]|uniref:dihydrodipicolinate synthase family protein n=1 Tax=Bradyrhizobium sp. Ash2021 TaxID=2954771 RepID=UPI002814CEB6|nr:dihydrodipicolinate synthase family protein [Bradyrhizobium sp. Ash2021]WMT76355.1 dihydrodipicolinate synthase family protein [Bradyrhizobium sp. Ash2021]